MSKYHPLDVRHPSNRDLLSRTYLLDPPPDRPTAPRITTTRTDSATPARSQTRRPSSDAASTARTSGQPVSAPWSGPSPTSVTRRTETALGGVMAFLRSAIIIGIVLIVIAQQTDLLDTAIFQLRVWALQMGIDLPF